MYTQRRKGGSSEPPRTPSAYARGKVLKPVFRTNVSDPPPWFRLQKYVFEWQLLFPYLQCSHAVISFRCWTVHKRTLSEIPWQQKLKTFLLASAAPACGAAYASKISMTRPGGHGHWDVIHETSHTKFPWVKVLFFPKNRFLDFVLTNRPPFLRGTDLRKIRILQTTTTYSNLRTFHDHFWPRVSHIHVGPCLRKAYCPTSHCQGASRNHRGLHTNQRQNNFTYFSHGVA